VISILDLLFNDLALFGLFVVLTLAAEHAAECLAASHSRASSHNSRQYDDEYNKEDYHEGYDDAHYRHFGGLAPVVSCHVDIVAVGVGIVVVGGSVDCQDCCRGGVRVASIIITREIRGVRGIGST
jgi:hypothetical protein